MDKEWLDLPQLIDQVQEYLDIGLDSEAKELLDNYAPMFTGVWELDFLYSRIYTDRNEPYKALEHLQRCQKAEKDNLDVLLGFFYAYTQLNDMRRAARYIMRAERLYNGNDLVLSALIWYYTEMSNFSRAIEYFERYAAMLGENPDVLRNAGIAYERIGDNEKARACFIKALDINPAFDEVRDLLADHYVLFGEIEKSITLYNEYLKQSPNNIRAISRLVFCYTQNNQFDEAEKHARASIALYPNSPVGYVDLAYTFLNANRLDESIESALKALDVAPLDSEAFRVLGIAYSEKNEDSRAEEAFQCAMRNEPNNPEIMRDYYHHLRNCGKFDEMKNLVQTVIRQEKPYCVEDYWFLADYFQENGQMLPAFHYLHKAYQSMPGEKELIPPMVDILLEKRHTFFALPFLKRYVESKGWNQTMDEYTRHKRFRNKSSQEGLRFLRYWSQKPHEFRRFIFVHYLQKFIQYAGLALFPLVIVVPALFFTLKAAILCGFGYAFFLGLAKLGWVINERRLSHLRTSAQNTGDHP